MRRKELFYYVTSGSNVMRDVHWCVTVFYLTMAVPKTRSAECGVRSAECGVKKQKLKRIRNEILKKIEIKGEFKSELSTIIKYINKLETEI